MSKQRRSTREKRIQLLHATSPTSEKERKSRQRSHSRRHLSAAPTAAFIRGAVERRCLFFKSAARRLQLAEGRKSAVHGDRRSAHSPFRPWCGEGCWLAGMGCKKNGQLPAPLS